MLHLGPLNPISQQNFEILQIQDGRREMAAILKIEKIAISQKTARLILVKFGMLTY